MQYMLIMRKSDESLADTKEVPFEEVIDKMGRYNESMIEAGVMVGGEGLTPPE